MRYLLAIILPPIAVFLCAKPFIGVLNIILTCFGYVPGIVHALFVVHSHKSDIRAEKLIKSMESNNQKEA